MSTFEEIKKKCLVEGKLWEDPLFGANPDSIRPGSVLPENWFWKRPLEITPDAKLIIDGASRFDLSQGDLGDCWFIASAAVLATKQDLFERVVPLNQFFDKDYAGIFCFNFWRFGKWEEVIVDDRLPVNAEGKLRYASNRTEPEFWGALIEKAYAKLCGSYRAIAKGLMRDALVDFTGGISETIDLKDEDDAPPNLFEIVLNCYAAGDIMGAGIWSEEGATKEEKMNNGLYKGHAYSITAVLETRVAGWNVKLIRLRNPWGRKEWNGAWSDTSDEWKAVPEEERKKIGLVEADDGEFWMSFDDFKHGFNCLDIIHLSPDTYARMGLPEDLYQWHEELYEGAWVSGVNAGGSSVSSGKELYYTNPQFWISLQKPDDETASSECTCLISIMLKDYRKRRADREKPKIMFGMDVHQAKEGTVKPLENENYLSDVLIKKQFKTKTMMREASCRLELNPGLYCIIPCTWRPNNEAEFVLRVYTHSKIKSGQVMEETKKIEEKPGAAAATGPLYTVPSDLFHQFAQEDEEIDARELRDILIALMKKDFDATATFGVDCCRALIALFDKADTGVLVYDEMCNLWDDVTKWRTLFQKHDKDKSGTLETYELKKLFREIGFTLSFETLSSMAVRYGGKSRTIQFEDFVVLVARFLLLYNSFKKYSDGTPEGEAKLKLDDWIGATIIL